MPTTESILGEGARFGAGWLRRHGAQLLLAFAGVLLPLWAFAELADEIHEQVALPFDIPLLEWAHGLHGPAMDGLMLWISRLGYGWGVVPVDVLLIALLLAWRRWREGLFASLAIIGSALLNMGTKRLFARERPALWESIAPENTWSFPSGHAMGSMTLVLVLLLLCWPTRWRWPMLVLGLPFVVLVGFSRVYLGVHYPSDVLAGWAAASAWVVLVWLLVFSRGRRPWQALADA